VGRADAEERVVAVLELDDADPSSQTGIDAADEFPEHLAE